MSRKVYFTFEDEDPYSPYDGGWTEVEADGYHEAVHAFEIFHPKRDGSSAVNCKQIYTDTEWESCRTGSERFLKGGCRERITVRCNREKCDPEGNSFYEVLLYTRELVSDA